MNQNPEDLFSPLRAAVVTAVQQLLAAQGTASAALPMGDGQMILAGETSALARMLGYGAPAAAAEAYAVTGATRFWLGRGPRGRMIFDREPNPADYPGITITAHVVMPLGGDQAAAGWKPVGAADPTLPAASQPAAHVLDEADQADSEGGHHD